jgi:hypothetical protein
MNNTILFLLFFIPLIGHSQVSWQPYAAVYYTGDAQMIYTGASYQLGADVPISDGSLVSPYLQYFEADGPQGSHRVATLALLYQRNFGAKIPKRFYIAAGLALQYRYDERLYWYSPQDRLLTLPAYRMGYRIHAKKMVISPELSATGPYIYHGGKSIELFTLPSVGVRFFQKESNRRI